MTSKWNNSGYFEMATRESICPPSWRWRIVRRGKPMGVRIESRGFSTYDAARIAGSCTVADFLKQLEFERFRID